MRKKSKTFLCGKRMLEKGKPAEIKIVHYSLGNNIFQPNKTKSLCVYHHKSIEEKIENILY